MFDPTVWASVPFHFWSAMLFIFGCIVGSFLNVCIHRLPRGESIINPPSHCPFCGYAIPWYLNIPLVTWLWLRGKCANCGAPISVRYLLVELLTGVAFLGAWLAEGQRSPAVALVYCVVLAGLIAATFIDFEHLIIPDEITLGGVVVGFLASFAVPALHNVTTAPAAMRASFWGIVVGGGVVYGILRLGKLLFGRQRFELPPDTRVVFREAEFELPDRKLAYEEVFHRKSDAIVMQAKRVELADRCYRDVEVRLQPERLTIGADVFNPEEVPHMEIVTDEIVIPREAMGLGDVKFMMAIGAFLGWPAVVFSLLASSFIGSFVGLTLVLLRRREWSARIPYGPYIAVAAAVWMFAGREIGAWWAAGAFFPR
jgi:leader peptidase (prepilin peptidase)/N-methyltransferase